MSRDAVNAVRLAVDEVSEVITSLSDEEWRRPSGCSGWTVKDLVAHMSSNWKETVEPSPPPPDPPDLPAERLMDMLVEPRTGWSVDEVRDEYLRYAPLAVDALAALQEEPAASTVIPLADLGHYPMHQLADAFAFDHYCHLRIDLLAPSGPVERAVATDDGTRLGPAIGWMLTGLPQMQPDLHRSLVAPIRLTLEGPGGGSWVLAADGGAITVTADPGQSSTDPVATVVSTGHDFVMWGTTRRPWRDHCRISGDHAVAAAFLDELDIV